MRILSLVLSLLTVCGIQASAFDNKQAMIADPLTAEILVDPGVIPAGANSTLKLLLKLAPGHHAYADMFQVTTQDSTLYRIGRFEIAPLVDFADPFSKRIRKVMENRAVMSIPIDISSDVSMSHLPVRLELTYQACTKDYCLFPKTMSVAIDLNLKPQEPASGLPMGWNQRLDQSFKKALDQNIAWAFLIVFIAGFLTSLTPCIFPMIPITLTVLGTRRDISTFQRFKLSLSYVLGIALTYSTLGMIVASTGALFGAFLGQPAVVVALAAVFVLMGFAMLGYFEIALPPKIQTFLSPKAGNAGWLEAAGSGLLAGLIASPCVGPVLVSVLTFVAQTKNVLLGFSLLFVFALGMGQLFLILGTSTKFVDRMPRSGSWMQGIQKLFAVCFFALAAWYVSPLLSSALLDGLLAVLLTASTVILGLFRRGLPKGGWRILYRTALLGVFFCGIYFGAQSFQQMFGHVSSGELPTSKLPWQPYSKAAMDAAFREHRPILIDFWADWCVACKELEVGPYSNAEVQSLSQQFLLVKFNATKPSAEFEELKKQYGIVGLPYVGFYDVSGHFRPDLTLTGFERTELFLQRMRQALKSHSQ